MLPFTLKILDTQPLILDKKGSKITNETESTHFMGFDEHRINIFNSQKVLLATFLASKVTVEFEKGTK